MAEIPVSMFLNNGRLDFSPNPVRVNPGDIVTWISRDGEDLKVEFPSQNNPFAPVTTFVGAKGQATPGGTVRKDVADPKHFECTVTLGGKVFHHASGVDTPGPKK